MNGLKEFNGEVLLFWGRICAPLAPAAGVGSETLVDMVAAG